MMNNLDDGSPSDGIESVPEHKVDLGRRRLGSVSAAGTAVLLSLNSRSAVAGWGTCTKSELASGNLSRAATANPCGCSPGFWWNKNGTALWTGGSPAFANYLPGKKFNTVFGVPYFNNTNITLSQVGPGTSFPHTPSDAQDNCAMHAVAALLNAAYFGARYPVVGLQNPTSVIAAFASARQGGKTALATFVSRVDVYSSAQTWCNNQEHSGSPV